MLVLGMGIGGVMQVLVIIVQNGVPHSELGVATSGATFFRSIGGSIGTAIFGAIFANVLVGNLVKHLHGITLPHGFSSADATPALLSHLPAAVHQGFVAGYAESIQTVFLVAVPIAALAFLATWLIPQIELKQWPEAAAAAPGTDQNAGLAAAGTTVAPEALANGTGPASPPPAHEALDPQDASRPDPLIAGAPSLIARGTVPDRGGTVPDRGGHRPAPATECALEGRTLNVQLSRAHGSAGTSTAYSLSTVRGTISSARSCVEARTTCAAAPS